MQYSYTDTACAYNTPLVYYLVLRLGTGEILTSNRSDRVQLIFTPPVVTGVAASRLQFSDHIHISWIAVAGAEKYLVHRYTARPESAPEYIFESTTNVFADKKENTDGAHAGIPYYYKVACAMHNAVSAPSANFTPGIYNTRVDAYESNDDKPQAAVIGDELCTACLCNFDGGVIQDTDWYKYPGTGKQEMLQITVTLPGGSPLIGKTILEIEGGGDLLLDKQENSLPCSRGEEPLYFRIYFRDADPEWNGIEEYKVKVDTL